MNNEHFEKASIGLHRSRSRFPINQDIKTSFAIGDLEPFDVKEILPGDTVTLDLAFVMRSQTPVCPAMDNAFLDIYYFFVPNQLVWRYWKNFVGEPSSASFSTAAPSLLTPFAYLRGYQSAATSTTASGYFGASSATPSTTALATWRSVGAQMGLPIDGAYSTATASVGYINALPLMGYCKIYDDWFRDPNYLPPLTWSSVNASSSSVTNLAILSANSLCYPTDVVPSSQTTVYALNQSSYALGYSMPCFAVSKFHDYFTSALPSPQRGTAVDAFTLATTAPLATTGDSASTKLDNPVILASSAMISGTSQAIVGGYSTSNPGLFGQSYSSTLSTTSPITYTNLVADLTSAVSSDINDLRLNIALQHYYEVASSASRYYNQILQAHFGVSPSPDRLERPEYLCGKRFRIAQHQVNSTCTSSNDVDDTYSVLGDTGAYGLTAEKDSLFTKSFTEHGYLIGVACIRYEHTYADGISRTFLRRETLDYYWPEFANIGETDVKRLEIYASPTDSAINAKDDTPISTGVAFGYQEAWADYRYFPNQTKAALRPSLNSGFQTYTYADSYSSSLGSSATFNREQPTFMRRNFMLTATKGLDFIIDIHLKGGITRVMPTYSVPGIDRI